MDISTHILGPCGGRLLLGGLDYSRMSVFADSKVPLIKSWNWPSNTHFLGTYTNALSHKNAGVRQLSTQIVIITYSTWRTTLDTTWKYYWNGAANFVETWDMGECSNTDRTSWDCHVTTDPCLCSAVTPLQLWSLQPAPLFLGTELCFWNPSR